MFIKYYIYAAVIAAVLGFGYWVKHLSDTVDKQKQVIYEFGKVIESRDKQIKETAAQALVDNANALQHQTKLQEIQNETEKLRIAVAAKPSILRVNATCPKLPATEPNTSTPTEEGPRLTEDARQGYIRLTGEIEEYKQMLADRDKRIAEDYQKCGPRAEK